MVLQRCSGRKYIRVYVITFAFLLSCFFIGFGDENENNQRQKEAAQSENKMPIIDVAKSLFSLPTASHYWILKVINTIFQQGWPYSSPPNLDFRGGSGKDELGKEGATEKVKEAVVKSLDKSKATVEDSAKSAAKFAEEAVDKTVKKLKKTLSGKRKEKEKVAEL